MIKQQHALSQTGSTLARTNLDELSSGLARMHQHEQAAAHSQCAQWVTEDSSHLHVDSVDSAQTALMPRLIWVFS